ncbi:MAG TPA: hypothetical protein VF992_00570 [Thermoplasmata archaeon]
MADDSIIGRYARVVVERGTEPLRGGLKLACRITGLAGPESAQKGSSLRGEVVSNDVDGPLPTSLVEGLLIITPEDPDVSEAKILQGGSFEARLGLLTTDGDLVASAEGALIRISQEVPFEGACPDCQGWKMCEDCGGTGGGPHAVCAYCRGTGQCTRCGGSGFVTESN